MARKPIVDSTVQLMSLRGLHNAVDVAVDGKEPHGGLSDAVNVAADIQEPHGGLTGAVGVAADGQEPHPMVDSP